MGEPAPPFPLPSQVGQPPPADPASANGSEPAPPAAATGQHPAAPPPEDAATELRAALDTERRLRIEAQQQLTDLRNQGMTEQEKAIAKAREEGRLEAV